MLFVTLYLDSEEEEGKKLKQTNAEREGASFEQAVVQFNLVVEVSIITTY